MKLPSTLLLAAAWMAAGAVAGADELLDRIPKVFERAAVQTELLLKQVTDSESSPRTLRPDGSLVTVKPEEWTSGFFPGTLWFLYEFDPSEKWKERAWEYTKRVESIRHFSGHHDVGFMLGCSYGNALRLLPDEASRAVLRDGAVALAKRYQPELGLIRSWDVKPFRCPVIIDNMMNLELLTWAAKNGGDASLREIAMSHADHTLQRHFRHDGSAYHIVDYDPKNQAVVARYSGQGADVDTPWARGQGWGIYGYTTMFRETGKKDYLEKAVGLADFCMKHPNLPKDKVPNWDFGFAEAEGVPRDASAAALMASGLIELSQLHPDGGRFLSFAREQLLALSSPAYLAAEGTNGGFILMHSTGHFPAKAEVDVPLVYADYYFLEALLRYRALTTGKNWVPFGAAK